MVEFSETTLSLLRPGLILFQNFDRGINTFTFFCNQNCRADFSPVVTSSESRLPSSGCDGSLGVARGGDGSIPVAEVDSGSGPPV